MWMEPTDPSNDNDNNVNEEVATTNRGWWKGGDSAAVVAAIGGYTEYEDDGVEDFSRPVSASTRGHRRHDSPWEDVEESEWEERSNCSNSSKSTHGPSTDEPSPLPVDPVLVYLTQQLSFQKSDAQRACRAVQTWSPAQPQQPRASMEF